MAPGSRATVAISAHYAPARIPFLATVLEAILGWDMASVRVVLISNDPVIMDEPLVVEAQGQFLDKDWSLTLNLAQNLAHPFNLTWHHKPLISSWLIGAQEVNDYFVYIEDDIVITNSNFEYFAENYKELGEHSLIPGFLRYEFRGEDRYSIDMNESQLVSIYPTVMVGDLKFVCPINPYWAGFILDRGLAQEYVATDSFDLDRSERCSPWGVRERAAMGLTWEAVPSRFKSRYVTPLVKGRPVEECLVWHCAQNYSAMPGTSFATLPIEKAFADGDVSMLVARAFRKLSRVFTS